MCGSYPYVRLTPKGIFMWIKTIRGDYIKEEFVSSLWYRHDNKWVVSENGVEGSSEIDEKTAKRYIEIIEKHLL